MNANKWSIEEDNILKEEYPKIGAEKCGVLLGRTKRACQLRAKKLSIKYVNNKYDKNNLLEVIGKSKTKSECLRYLNIPTNAGNFDTLNRYIIKYDIDISHFEYHTNELKNYIRSITIPLEDILVENSTYSNRDRLKNRLYNSGLKSRKCELCGQSEYWMGKKMSLILDHKNGINNDNRLENLRIVCPNCNATLDTHCRGSKVKRETGDKDYCICGKIKWKTSKSCVKCNSLSNRKVKNRPPLEKLLKDIEETNYVLTGKKYGVTDNTIRKWIKYYKNV